MVKMSLKISLLSLWWNRIEDAVRKPVVAKFSYGQSLANAELALGKDYSCIRYGSRDKRQFKLKTALVDAVLD